MKLRLSHHESHDHTDHDNPDHGHDLGLSHDLPRILGRRRLIAGIGGVGAAAALAACGTESTSGSGSSASASGSAASGTEIPEETAGPYPGDGSNGPDVLGESGVVRSDITTSFGDLEGTAQGVPTTVRLRIYDSSGDSMEPYAGAALYLWHCDREGQYSLYTVADQNYLRGVQEADADGQVEFKTVFPAAYSGRWPHMHFEVYPTLDDAQSASNRLRTSQLALPEEVCQEVYDNAEGYDASVANLANTSLETDMVFSDGYSLQMAKVTGSVEEGYTVSLNVPV